MIMSKNSSKFDIETICVKRSLALALALMLSESQRTSENNSYGRDEKREGRELLELTIL